jgi:hypothetical protein
MLGLVKPSVDRAPGRWYYGEQQPQLRLRSEFAMNMVPDFFQDESEEAMRAQVKWQHEHLGLGDSFFARLLGEDERRFCSWQEDADTLAPGKECVLRDWWKTVLHLLSFQRFDEEKLRSLLEQTRGRGSSNDASPFSPPWSASSLKTYLESRGPDAIAEVNRWVESFRFGDPYAPLR